MRIHQILLNLISNALKFSKENQEITIFCNILEDKSKENICIVEIRVIDFGIGISEDDQKNLFTPFFKTTNLNS